MERRKQVQWLKVQKGGFFRHFLTHGLAFCVPFVFGSAFVQNGFYLNLSPFISFRLYLATIFGAVFFAGSDWIFKSRQYQKHRENLLRKNVS
ncbi:hypothetical protein [Vibrio parahaemolyticus]|uniref:hypothetical protein n=1 Tax=Vibrio parahaemolyticus TaxID=670 RepID=UPI000471D652|nr:hypothetical protein [Vibrio parahaemolyticus]KYY28472.1 hypothetical protein AWQ12_23270 [Vibrio parahaemolyticus]